MKKISQVFLIVLAIACSANAIAQNTKPRVSPPDSVSGKLRGARIAIHYSSPSVKGRVIYGMLVPYDSVWRAGANEATTFETDKDIKVEGRQLPEGKYSFFLLPRKKGKWSAISNKVPDKWDAFKHDESKDQLRVDVKPTELLDTAEKLNYQLTHNGFSLNWDKVSVPVSLK